MRIIDTALASDANMSSYYMLDGNSNDQKGGRNGTDTNITYIGSLWGQAASKTTSGYIQMTSPFTSTNNWTIGCWFNLTNQSQKQAIIGIGGGAAAFGYTLQNTDGGDVNGGNHLVMNFPGVVVQDTGTTVSTGTWYHVVMMRNAGTAKIYLNGVTTGSTTGSAPLTPDGKAGIGVRDESSTIKNPMAGIIDEAFFYNAVMSDANIALLAIPPRGGFLSFM